MDERGGVDERGVESQFACEGCFGFEFLLEVRIDIRSAREVKESRDPGEITIDVLLSDDAFNFAERMPGGLPDGLSLFLAEGLNEAGESRVCDIGEVCGGVAGFAGSDAISFEEGDFEAGLFEEVCGGDAGHSTADDGNIDVEVAGESWEF